ncbi:MAG: M48 family metalloprotease [Phycisphaerales bacterium]|nr:M48 family metalloprotease [Phycisphaerales bacterium]
MHISLILCFLAIYLHDSFGGSLGITPLPPAFAAACSLGSFALLITITHLAIRRLIARIDLTGSWPAIRAAELIVRRSRLLAVILHVSNIWLVGWAQAVRAVTTDLILLDELIILAPLLISWAMGWYSIEPIERRLREAALMRDLDSGKPIYPIISRRQFVISNMRYHVLLILIPMCLLLVWAETVERFSSRLGGYTAPIQLAGVVLVFILMPLALRMVWDTTPLGPGPLRESLLALCRRARVRIGNLLVWRTHGLMLNGAVIGLIWPLRYILLTDALLDALSKDQVEAVAAHEVGHIRRHHLPWLGITMVTAIFGSGMVLTAIQASLMVAAAGGGSSPLTEALLACASLAISLFILGYVSRRFEWQADAFAVCAISRQITPDGAITASKVVTPEAIIAMQSALSLVAQASGLPIRMFTWRHGSIYTRQRKLAALAGRSINHLPIDRQVRWLKAVVAGAAVGIILLGAAIYLLVDVLGRLAPAAP